MKNYNRLMALILAGFAATILLFNVTYAIRRGAGDRLYNVEINRLMDRFANGALIGAEALADCERIIGVDFLPVDSSQNAAEHFFTDNQYVIRPLYRDDSLSGYIKFRYSDALDLSRDILWQNVVLSLLFCGVLVMLLYIRRQIVRPMNVFSHMPAALAKGDFTTPVRAQKGKFFGRFLWGLDMLRETLAQERQRALALEKEKSETALSISHDIKTPLNAILLASKALQEGLYPEPEKQDEMLQKIDVRAHEIERLVAELQRSVSEDMLDLPVNIDEFYLSDVISRVDEAYRWQLELVRTEFTIDSYSNCLLIGDMDRIYEAICNLMENAVKYGDGKQISILFSREEGCQLITVSNTGNTLSDIETVRLFESFWRGSNATGKPGNGLGLFIARQLVVKMGGDAFATSQEGEMRVTLVLRMA